MRKASANTNFGGVSQIELPFMQTLKEMNKEFLVSLKSICFLVLFFFAPFLMATVVNLSPSKDTFLDQNGPTTNYGSQTHIEVYPRIGSTASRRVIIHFDLSSIPSGSVINSATLKLTETATYGSTRTIAVHKLTTSWSEASATWNSPWTTTGGDYNATASTTTSISWTGVLKTDNWTLTSDVNSFVNGGATNYGWLLKDNAEDNTQEYWRFAPKEYATAASRPILTVDYTAPLPVSLITFNAHYEDGKVKTSWSTASEVNNDYFTVERSVDGIVFEALTLVNGKGNSNQVHFYEWMDEVLPDKKYLYYRLRQTDFDGKYEVFNMVYVQIPSSSYFNIQGYQDKYLINVSNDFSGNLLVTDAQGKELYFKCVFPENKNFEISLDCEQAGYFFILFNEHERFVKKVIRY